VSVCVCECVSVWVCECKCDSKWGSLSVSVCVSRTPFRNRYLLIHLFRLLALSTNFPVDVLTTCGKTIGPNYKTILLLIQNVQIIKLYYFSFKTNLRVPSDPAIVTFCTNMNIYLTCSALFYNLFLL